MGIEKETAVPLYEQICSYVKENIGSGKYVPGELLPSEADFQKKFGVSRITVRRALKILCEQGLLRSVQGKGTYVNDLYSKDWSVMRSFSNDVVAQGHIPSTKIVSFKKIKAPQNIAENLEVLKGTEVYALKRLRYIDGTPFWLTTSYILADIAQGLSADYFSRKGSAQSLFFVLHQDFGVDFKVYKEIKGPEQIDSKEVQMLGQTKEMDVQTKASLFRDSNDKAIVYESTVLIVTKEQAH